MPPEKTSEEMMAFLNDEIMPTLWPAVEAMGEEQLRATLLAGWICVPEFRNFLAQPRALI